VTIGFWHEYSRILQRNSLYTLRPNHNGDCYRTDLLTPKETIELPVGPELAATGPILSDSWETRL
ncbi:MAG: hypothetical protein V7K19_17210, partial [Nostoc sp.]